MCCGDIGILKVVPPRSQAAVGGRREERLGGGGRGKTREESHGSSEEVRLGRQAQVGLVESVVPWGGGVCTKIHSVQELCTTAFLRMLLCSLVRVKLGCYELEGKNSQSLEEYLKAFMETEVKPLWPKGWMQTRCLAFPPAVCSFHTKTFFLSSYIHIHLSVQQDFIQREHYGSWSPHRLHVSCVFLVFFFGYYFFFR